MTVVYPIDCPAGWHIIGRTPVELFSLSSTPPAKLAPGDTIRFAPVSRSDYDDLEAAVQRSEWRLEAEEDRS
jgi:allophanate hydrolase subunit 1